ncbi:hypothetical protein BKA70DRAFT_1487880 [Coprinopsis sp. MPI-PUGE-AT-0042]|nr:hypothetical protein BKA70DRAFT_1487880 [Coprinopsis sp. MPI-PUGE-AT-0042]
MDLQNNSRQRSSPANDHSSPSSPQNLQNLQQQQLFMAQQQQQQQQQNVPQSPYTFPAQQQPQGSWTPSINATPFLPLVQGTPQFSPAGQIPGQAPFFDPTNAQLQAWTYQQMVMHGYPGLTPQQQLALMQRNGGGHMSPNEYFAANQIPSPFNNFPSGTPPPHARGGAADHQSQSNQYPSGYHPYRRPNRQQSQSGSDTGSDRRPQAPYMRSDASGSTSSVNSTGSRQRTNSNQSGHSGTSSPATGSGSRSRSNTASSATSSSARSSPSPAQPSSPSPSPLRNNVHGRSGSTSSAASTATATTTRPSGSTPSSTPPAPSPHQHIKGPFESFAGPACTATVAAVTGQLYRREAYVRDDSDLAAMLSPPQDATSSRSIKSRLRRALSFNPSTSLKETLKEEEAERDDDASIKASAINGATSGKAKNKSPAAAGSSKDGSGSTTLVDDGASTATVQTKKKGRAASFTDNISLSSTVSSASVMIRKLGSLGNLGSTELDKDKEKEKEGDKDKKGKKKDKKSAKAEASEASVSHVTAELDRGSEWSASPELNGLTPACKAGSPAHPQGQGGEGGCRSRGCWTRKRSQLCRTPIRTRRRGTGLQTHTQPGPGVHINEDGSRVLVEDDEEESDDGHYTSSHGHQNYSNDGWDDDDWDAEVDQEEDQAWTTGPEVEPWAVDVRRSVERTRVPKKGILKHAGTYSQSNYGPNAAQSQTRTRSNSYNAPGTQSELGPLARIPSPDPDHIDGLHRHGQHSSHPSSSSENVSAPSLPPLSFDSDSSPLGATFSGAAKEQSDPATAHSQQDAGNRSSIFQNPSFNSSAPVLSNIGRASPVPHPRTAVAEKKQLTFATSLAVYDTFAPSIYDRRSEPATWSRLTPQLAQRIKEELNSYKMEEMEVHAASRIHTQFFV